MNSFFFLQAIKAEHNTEIERLQTQLDEVTSKTQSLQQREAEESHTVEDSHKELSRLKDLTQEKEDQIIVQERKLASLREETDNKVADIQQDGKRRIKQAEYDRAAVEKQFDALIASHPKQRDFLIDELDDVKADNEKELKLADDKINAMLENRKCMLKDASAELLRLRKETGRIEKEVDDARKAKVLGKAGTKPPLKTKTQKKKY